MSASATGEVLAPGGVTLHDAMAALRRREPFARAFWLYDLDAFRLRARRLHAALAPFAGAAGSGAHVAYALKANGLPAIARAALAAGLDADAGSLGELELASSAGFPAARRTLSGNGRTPEEAEWAARAGVALVSADHVGELDLLEAAARTAQKPLRVALRINPGIETPGHRHVATGHDDAKFGVATSEALEALAARARWPHLTLDGVHLHVGSQLLDPRPLEQATRLALEIAAASASRGAPLGVVNLGGGFGVDYTREEPGFPLEEHLAGLAKLTAGSRLSWRFEPGRWLVAPIGVLVAEVLWIKRRGETAGERRFVVLAAGMNDLLRPALYGARHRIVAAAPRAGAAELTTVVGPVCETGDTFATDVPLPPLEQGDLVVIHDAGAYGAAMSSNYNGRGRLAELVVENGTLMRVRAGEQPRDLLARDLADRLPLR